MTGLKIVLADKYCEPKDKAQSAKDQPGAVPDEAAHNNRLDGGQLLSTPDCNSTIARGNDTRSQALSSKPEAGAIATKSEPASDKAGTQTRIEPGSLIISADALYSPKEQPDKPSPEEQAKIDYEKARADYKKQVNDYWTQAEQTKKAGGTVNDFPPVYDGPAKPKGYDKPAAPSTLPSVNDLQEQSRDLLRIAGGDKTKPDFALKEISETAFKAAYVKEALHVGAEQNLSKDEVKKIVNGIYAFECGGKATHDTLSSVPLELTKPDEPGSTANLDARRQIHPESTALGYNQIMKATSLTFLEKNSATVAARLRENARGLPGEDQVEEKATLYENLHAVLHKELSAMANKDDASKAKYLDKDGNFKYSLYGDFSKSDSVNATGLTGRQLANAVHALNLDGDVGPIVQSMQLKDVVSHSLSQKMKNSLEQKANELASRAGVYDSLPADKKAAAINELFSRTDNQKSAEMLSLRQKIEKLPDGLSENIARKNLSEAEWRSLNSKILSMRKAGDNGNPVSAEGRALLDKLTYAHFTGPRGSDFLSAAVQLGNLAGTGEAERMLQPANSDLPTVNFFEQKGYEGNPPVPRRSADELLRTIHRIMHGPNADPKNWGNAQFEEAFAKQP